MTLSIEPGAQVVERPCPECVRVLQRVTAFVYRDGDAYASCYHHGGHEVWIDVIFSPTWDDAADDRETFGCRVGPVEGQTEPAASLVTAGQAFPGSRIFGRKLTRDDALANPQLSAFLLLVDHILMNDSMVRRHVYGTGAVFETAVPE